MTGVLVKIRIYPWRWISGLRLIIAAKAGQEGWLQRSWLQGVWLLGSILVAIAYAFLELVLLPTLPSRKVEFLSNPEMLSMIVHIPHNRAFFGALEVHPIIWPDNLKFRLSS